MRVLLVHPRVAGDGLWNVSPFRFPSITLPIVATATPADVETRIIDENVEPVDFDAECDLVGISSITCSAPRAYEIADQFRNRGKTVVIGGLHASVLPDEALEHADVVVIGEAEPVWQEVIDDFKKGEMKKTYRSAAPADLANLPSARRDLLKRGSYSSINVIQATRGCKYDCEFCCITRFFGRTYRLRPVEKVVREIETMDRGFLFFVDDNIICDTDYAKQLFKELKPLNIKWVSQFTLDLARDDELLRLCAQSGCIGAFIGFESLSRAALREIHKPFSDPEKYATYIRKIHDRGIGIEGAFVFGFDKDDGSVFEKTLEFAVRSGIEVAQFSILTPFPGTRLFERLSSQDRIVEKDWALYDAAHVVFVPTMMRPEDLQDGFNWIYQQFYSYTGMAKRLLGSRRHLTFYGPFNWGFRKLSDTLPRVKELGKA